MNAVERIWMDGADLGDLVARKERAIRARAKQPCQHPPARLYSWTPREIANDPTSRRMLCVGCCDCGKSWERPL